MGDEIASAWCAPKHSMCEPGRRGVIDFCAALFRGAGGKGKGVGRREWRCAVWGAEYGSSFASEVAPIPSVPIIGLRTRSAGSASSAGRTWTPVPWSRLMCSLDRLNPPPWAVGAGARGDRRDLVGNNWSAESYLLLPRGGP
jgi:hypothetical protein